MEVFHGDVADPQPVVQRRTEHHAAALQHILRQRGRRHRRRWSGGARPRHRSIQRRRPARCGLPLLQNGADVGAVAALDAAVRHLRVEEALPIRDHANGPLGQPLQQAAQPVQRSWGRQLGRGIQLGHGGYLLNYAYSTILPHGGKKHKCGGTVRFSGQYS